jgi:2-dehydro-3-deoxygluconokinase
VSRLTRNPLGRIVANHGREAGVDMEHVVWTDDDRVGVYFLEFGAAPRASSVLYDRKDSAIAHIQPGMVNWQTVLSGARWFHVTGITPALSSSAAAATAEALACARQLGLRTSIDLNYRAKLWTTAQAGKCMSEFMANCDVLMTTEEDLEKVFQIKGANYEEAAAQAASRFNLQVVAITLRENPLVWKNSWTGMVYTGGKILRTGSYEVEIVDRLGAGDSFAAGFIHASLEAGDWQRGLDYGVAVSAIKHSIPGDFAWVSPAEVESLLKGGGLRISR